MTAISTILSVVMLPVNLLLYTRFSYEDDVVKNLDWKSLFVALLVVISAIFIGLYCSFYFKSKRFHRGANAVCFYKIDSLGGIFFVVCRTQCACTYLSLALSRRFIAAGKYCRYSSDNLLCYSHQHRRCRF